jgi:hypothetical protein
LRHALVHSRLAHDGADRSQVGGEVLPGGVAEHRVARGRALEDHVEGGRNAFARRAGHGKVAEHDSRGERRRAVGREGKPPHEELVEHDPEGVHVRLHGSGLALDLLRGHVSRRADDHRARGIEREVGEGDAEVGDLGLAVGAHEDVGGLEVAMDRTARVGVGKRVAALLEQLGDATRLEQRGRRA